MRCRALRTLAVGIGALLLSGPARAADTDEQAHRVSPRKRLDLGLYGPPYLAPGREPQAGFRFDAWVDVEGAPARDLEESMAVWLRHFDLGEPAVYGSGYYNARPDAEPNAVNVLPLFEELYHKLKKRKK